ncbi:MAG: peptide-methionine (S)-S-oxide reductase MsrA [Anaerovoracaceae bacterium]
MIKDIYFAGGCFWSVQMLFSDIKGVNSSISGYANGKDGIIPNYELVCTGTTDFRETVKVSYDDKIVSLEDLVKVFYSVIDPTQYMGQGYDKGTQYQTGIYFVDEDSKKVVEEITSKVKEEYNRFYVETLPLKNFYEAEEVHQDYLKKNPKGDKVSVAGEY